MFEVIDRNARSTHRSTIGNQGLAIFVQFLAAAMTPKDDENVLKSRSDVSPRLSTLTVIIIGKHDLLSVQRYF